MKSLTWLFESLLADAGRQCGTDSIADVKYVCKRVEHEGSAFLSITLPTFAQAFERSLEEGSWCSPHAFAKKRTRAGKSCLPSFLMGFTSQVFNSETGELLKSPSLDAILAIRQISLVAKKVFARPTPAREKAALRGYIQVEEDLRYGMVSEEPHRGSSVHHRGGLRACVRSLFAGLGARCRQRIADGRLAPRHGPGATADRLQGNAKFDQSRWYRRWEAIFPPDHYWFLNHGDWVENGESLHIVEPSEEDPVRVLFVPKTQKAPRIIAMEPTCMQYMQQGLGRALMDLAESDSLFGGHINFEDQSVNRRLAQESSSDGKLATLDLSEASDRLSCKIVWDIFDGVPEVRDAVFALRSSRAELPNGEVMPLRKFASQGSALCFPVESLAFFAIIIYARLRFRNLEGRVPTRRLLRKLIEGVYVYGDDLIVPVDEVPIIIDTLQLFGLKVNADKSFWTGKFRESCGGDYYGGEPVKPVYLRREFPDGKRRVTEVISWISTANQFYMAGWWSTAAEIRLRIEAVVGSLPVTSYHDVSYLHWKSVRPCRTIGGWNRDLQTFVVRSLRIQSTYRKDMIDGYPALRKTLLETDLSDLQHGGFLYAKSDGYSYPLDGERREINTAPGTGVKECCLHVSEPIPVSHQQDEGRQVRGDGCHLQTGLRSFVGHGQCDGLGETPDRRRDRSDRLKFLDGLTSDKEHLVRSVRRGAVTLRRRWNVA